MHIHGQLYAPAREQALPQFELQVKQAARQRASERASDPIQPFTLDLPSQFWVPCDFSSPIWGVCSQGLCALAACHESGINFVLLFQTPKNTNYENIFFSVHREKKGKLSTGIQEFSKYDLAPLLLDLIF